MDKQTLARTITALIIAILDVGKLLGFDFGIENDDIYTFILAVISIAYAIRIWWKNNNVTTAARAAQHVLDEMKGKHEPDVEFIQYEMINDLGEDEEEDEDGEEDE